VKNLKNSQQRMICCRWYSYVFLSWICLCIRRSTGTGLSRRRKLDLYQEFSAPKTATLNGKENCHLPVIYPGVLLMILVLPPTCNLSRCVVDDSGDAFVLKILAYGSACCNC